MPPTMSDVLATRVAGLPHGGVSVAWTAIGDRVRAWAGQAAWGGVARAGRGCSARAALAVDRLLRSHPTPTPAPQLVNWTLAGKVGPIHDQKNCGSCWAMSTLAAIESMQLIQNGQSWADNPLDWSEQQLVVRRGWDAEDGASRARPRKLRAQSLPPNLLSTAIGLCPGPHDLQGHHNTVSECRLQGRLA